MSGDTQGARVPRMDSTPGERHHSHAGSSSLEGADLQFQANAIGAYIHQPDFNGTTVTGIDEKVETETNLVLMDDAREAGGEVDHDGLIATVQATYIDTGSGMDLQAKDGSFPLRPGREGTGVYSEFDQGVIDGAARIEQALSNSEIPILKTEDGTTWDTVEEPYFIVEPEWEVEFNDGKARIKTPDGEETHPKDLVIRREDIKKKRHIEIISRVEGGPWMKFIGPIYNDQYRVRRIPEEDEKSVLDEFSGEEVQLKPEGTGTAVRVYYPFSGLERERTGSVYKRLRPCVNWLWEQRVYRFYGIMNVLGEQNIDIHLTWEDSYRGENDSVVIPKLDYPYYKPTRKAWVDEEGNKHPTVVSIDTTFSPPSGGQWLAKGEIGVIDPELDNKTILADRPDDDLNGFDPLFPRRDEPQRLHRLGSDYVGIRVSDRGMTKTMTEKVLDRTDHPSLYRLKGHIDVFPPEGEHVPAGISKSDEEHDMAFMNALKESIEEDIDDYPTLPGDQEEEEVELHDVMKEKQDKLWSWFEDREVEEKFVEEKRSGIPFDNIVEFDDDTSFISDQKTTPITRSDAGQMWANLVDIDSDDDIDVEKYILVAWGINASATPHLKKIANDFPDIDVMYRNAYKYLFKQDDEEVMDAVKHESNREYEDLLNKSATHDREKVFGEDSLVPIDEDDDSDADDVDDSEGGD